MPKPILYLFRGEDAWMLSQDIPEDEGGLPPRAAATSLRRDVDVETVLNTLQAEMPDYHIRLASWHRPKRDV